MTIRISSALLLCAALACSTSGSHFDPDSVVRIEPKRSTQADVEQIFGKPTSLRTRSNGTSRYIYEYTEEINRDTGTLSRIGRWIGILIGGRPVFSPINVQYKNSIRHRLTVLFDRDGVVEDYTYERTDKPTRRVY
ncbi:MAG: outer membrane protein assembly factor BamE [bacterium]|nr:outer membrane protein assembly factor BamE [bacterium]